MIMKKVKILPIFLFALFLFVNVSLAQPFEVIPLSSDITIKAGQSYQLKVILKNNQNFDDTFTISYYPYPIQNLGISLEKTSFKVPANSEHTFLIYFSTTNPAIEITPFYFQISATSLKTGYTQSKQIIIRVVKSYTIYISDVLINKQIFKPNENLEAKIFVTNLEEISKKGYSLSFLIKKDENVIYSSSKSLEILPKETKEIIFNYTFGKYAQPGKYDVIIYLKDPTNKIIDSKSLSIFVEEISFNPLKSLKKEVSYSILGINVKIQVKNEGNVKSNSFYISESLPSYLSIFFAPLQKPDKTETIGSNVVYYWYVSSLEPGKEFMITYNLFLFPIWVAAIIVILIIIWFFKFFLTISIKKKHFHEGVLTRNKEIKVSVEVKNRTNKVLKNVYVKDYIPPLVRLIKKFDTVPPKIRKAKDHIELIWRIPVLKPKEERIFTYHIQPIVDIVGKLHLPKAVIVYKKGEKTKKAKSSKVIITSEEETKE